jgi:hypothetical protein
MREKKYSIWEAGESKMNALTANNPPVFRLNFPKGVIHAPGHVTTLFFPANEKLRGFEHGLLKQRTKKANLITFWARPT